jgi:anaerobic carbon-monoxide dehydrogenase iron sulfur subunit
VIKFKQEVCIGCRVCETICSMEHFKEINNSKARIRYRDDWPRIGEVLLCRQCPQRLCIKACPEEALLLNNDGYVQIIRDNCTGCMACSEACPYGTLPVEGNYPLYCDTCNGLYQCVQWCPTKALKRVGEKLE